MTEPESEIIGREQVDRDVMDPARAQALHATLERPGAPPSAGDPLPPLWHWIYFWSIAPMAELGHDGHLALGRFLPDLGLPRRMWAGSRFTFHRPLTLGAAAERHSTIAEVVRKAGRSGPLAFVTVRHRLTDGEGLCVEEEQDLVFRSDHEPGAERATPPLEPRPAPSDEPVWQRTLTADPVLLFRYSALTFNGHRIHYDRDFACGTEGYPGLIVHGPLLGLLMCQLGLEENPDRRPAGYRFRLSHPVFAGEAFGVAGGPTEEGGAAKLWVRTESGALAAEGQLEFD